MPEIFVSGVRLLLSIQNCCRRRTICLPCTSLHESFLILLATTCICFFPVSERTYLNSFPFSKVRSVTSSLIYITLAEYTSEKKSKLSRVYGCSTIKSLSSHSSRAMELEHTSELAQHCHPCCWCMGCMSRQGAVLTTGWAARPRAWWSVAWSRIEHQFKRHLVMSQNNQP